MVWKGRRAIKKPELWVWLVFSCWIWSHWCSVFLYGSVILGQLLVTRRGISKPCMLKGAVNDSCTQNWDDLDHYQVFLQRRLTGTALSYPSVTTYTSGKCKGISGWKHQSLKISMQGWNKSSHLRVFFFVTFHHLARALFYLVSCFSVFKCQTKPSLFSLQVSCKRRIS